MEFKLASERPSEVMGARLSNDISHCTIFGGKRPNVRDQNKVNGSCISFNIDFLTCHFKDHPGLLDGDKTSCWGELPESLDHLSHPAQPSQDWETPSPSGLNRLTSNDLSADWAWTRDFLLPLLGPVASWLTFKAFPLAGFTSRRMVKLPWPPWVVLRLQGIADCYGHQFSLRPGLLVYVLDSLSSSSAWSQLLNTSKAMSRSWNIRVCRPNCNFWSFHLKSGVDWLILCCLSRDWPLEVDRLVLVNFLKDFTSHPWFSFFLGHAFNNLFKVNWLSDTLSHPF